MKRTIVDAKKQFAAMSYFYKYFNFLFESYRTSFPAFSFPVVLNN